MSYYFQGSLVHGDRAAVQSAFGTLRSPAVLRLCRFSESVFGIYSVQPMNWDEFVEIVRQISTELGLSVHYFFNSIAGEFISLYEQGQLVRKFSNEADAIWIAIDEDGMRIDWAQYRDHERPVNRNCEYLRSPLDAALDALGESGLTLCRDSLYAAFCMNECGWLRESSPVRQGRTPR